MKQERKLRICIVRVSWKINSGTVILFCGSSEILENIASASKRWSRIYLQCKKFDFYLKPTGFLTFVFCPTRYWYFCQNFIDLTRKLSVRKNVFFWRKSNCFDLLLTFRFVRHRFRETPEQKVCLKFRFRRKNFQILAEMVDFFRSIKLNSLTLSRKHSTGLFRRVRKPPKGDGKKASRGLSKFIKIKGVSWPRGLQLQFFFQGPWLGTRVRFANLWLFMINYDFFLLSSHPIFFPLWKFDADSGQTRVSRFTR